MARDQSIYGAHDSKNGKVCFARIITVDPKTRTCRVKTIGSGSGFSGTNDLDQQNVQFISLANHVDGDEDTYIPRPGQYGVVIFINTEPYLLGYYQPPLDTGSQELQNRVPLNSGDRIIKMIAGNRIILRAGGTVEIESTKLCRTYWLPNQNVINSICQNYELETDGGSLFWERNDETGDTNLDLFAYDNVNPVNAVDFQLGHNDDGASIITLSMGPLDDQGEVTAPVFDLRVQPAKGNTTLNIRENLLITVGPDGAQHTFLMDSDNKQFLISSTGGANNIIMDDNDKTITIIHSSGSSNQWNAEGEWIAQDSHGNTFSLAADQATMAAKGSLVSVSEEGYVLSTVDGGCTQSADTSGNTTVTAKESWTCTSQEFTADCGSIFLGSDPIYNSLLAQNTMAWLGTHIHPAPQAPTGVLLTLPPVIPPYAYAGTPLDLMALFIFLRGNLP